MTGDETPGTAALEPRQCPRCHTMNTYDALYCRACSMALTEHAAYQVDEKSWEGREVAFAYSPQPETVLPHQLK